VLVKSLFARIVKHKIPTMSEGPEQERIRARARLALRAERAFGVGMLPVSQIQEAEHLPQAGPSGPGPTPQKPVEIPKNPDVNVRLVPSSKASTDLFGNPTGRSSVATTLPVLTTPVLSRSDKIAELLALDQNSVKVCNRCRLCEQRTNTVFGEGDADAKIFFIGEGPGENEDLQGRPFVGRAGELLNKWIAAMGLKREQVYIANIVKCRPPGNREPAPDEVATCTPYLQRQLEIIRPPVIMTLGKPAAQHMLNTKNSMGRIRGQWHEWRGMKLMPTYHPAYVLRNYTYDTRAAVWSDLQMVMKELGLEKPRRESNQQS
jgi:uracil-DNA glycosylase